MFEQILDLVGGPPGSLVYHFIILFALEAALAMSLGQWMRERDSGTARLTIAAGAVCLLRLLLLAASLLAWQGYLPRSVLLPPVERVVDTLSIIALAWAFTTMDDPRLLDRNLAPDLGAAVLGSVALAGFVGTYYFWSVGTSNVSLFNGLWIDLLWGISQAALALVGLIWMLSRARYVFDPFLKGLMLILLGAAAAYHVIDPVLGDIAAAMRLGQIIVMPMLAAVAYRHVVEQLLHWDEFEPSASSPAYQRTPASDPGSTKEHDLPPVFAATPPPAGETVRAPEADPMQGRTTIPMLEVIEALGGLLATLEEREMAREAPRVVAMALRADICLLAVVDENTQQAGVIGGYDNIAQAYLPMTVLDLSRHPTIVNTLGRLRQMRLTPQRNQRELRDLYDKLGITHDGPAYLQPLVNGEERLGVLVVGSPYSERMLSNDERNLLDRLAPLVTAALLNAEKHQDAREEVDQVIQEEGARLSSLSDQLTASSAELNAAQRQITEMKAYIRDMHRQLQSGSQSQESSQEQTDTLLAEVERLRQAAQDTDSARSQLDLLKIRYEELLAERNELRDLQVEAVQLQSDNARLLEQAQKRGMELTKLEEERDRLQGEVARIGELAAQNERLQDEISRLRAQPPPPAVSASNGDSSSELALLKKQLEEARSSAQMEIASLRTRLTQAGISGQEVIFLQEQLGVKTREAVSLQTRLIEAEATLDALRKQVSARVGSTAELNALTSRIADQASEIARLRVDLAEAQVHLRTDTAELRAGREQIDQDTIAQLESHLAERATLIAALESQLAEKSRAIVELRGHMAEVDSSLKNLERQLAFKAQEVETLQNNLNQAKDQAQARMSDLQAQMAAGSADDSSFTTAEYQALSVELEERDATIAMLEDQLKEATEQLASIDRQLADASKAVDAAISESSQVDSRDEVIASMVQELRTPMSSIMGYTELLLRESVGILGTGQRKFLQRVKANTERMGTLLDDMLRITAIESENLELSAERVDAVYVAEEAITGVSSQFREKGITLRLAIADGLPPILADRSAIHDVLGHLLSNSALASPVGGQVHLTVTTRRGSLHSPEGGDYTANCLYVSVRDSGAGIDEADQDRVFARKYRADNPLIEGLGDTGVTLSLAKALVDAHGGQIWFDSQKGQGTVFHVLIPIDARDGEESST